MLNNSRFLNYNVYNFVVLQRIKVFYSRCTKYYTIYDVSNN